MESSISDRPNAEPIFTDKFQSLGFPNHVHFPPLLLPRYKFLKGHCLSSSNQKGPNIVTVTIRHTKIQLHFRRALNAGFFQYQLRLNASSFGWISNLMVREGTSGFQLAWYVIWKPGDGNLSAKIGSALGRSEIELSTLVSL